MYPSEEIRESLVSKKNLSFIRPVPAFILFLKVLKEPNELSKTPKAFFEISFVFKFNEAPNAAAPLDELLTPLCKEILSTDETKSGMLTQ